MKKRIIQFAIRLLKNMDEPDLKREILIEAVKDLYNSISSDEILRLNSNGKWTYKGREMTDAEMDNIRNEVQAMKGMKLWDVIKNDIRYQLGKKMFEEAKCKDDLLWGQLTTYLFDIIKARLNGMGKALKK